MKKVVSETLSESTQARPRPSAERLHGHHRIKEDSSYQPNYTSIVEWKNTSNGCGSIQNSN